MKTIIIYTLVLFITFSCKKDDAKSYEEELTQSIQTKIAQELKQDGSTLESIQLVEFDTLSERQEADLVLQHSYNRLMRLNNQQKQLTDELDNVKTAKDLEWINSRYAKVKDSIKNEMKIGETVKILSPKDYKTGNYQAVFLLKVFNQKSDVVKNDSLFMYLNEKKMIFTQQQFIEQYILKFTKD